MEKTKQDDLEPKTKEIKLRKKVKNKSKTDTSKIYELAVLFLPSLSESEAQSEFSAICKEILNSKDNETGGVREIISSEDPVFIDLAYSMSKAVSARNESFDQGYFGWVKFEMEAEDVKGIEKILKNIPSILRFMIIKTVRENTLLSGKMVLKREEKFNRNEEEKVEADIINSPDKAVSKPIDEGEIEKSINDLVIE